MESRARERWTVILLGIATFFLFADQNLMAPNLTMIAREFGFTDVERDQKLGGDIEAAIRQHRPKLLALCQGDTSTTMLQPLEHIGRICREHGVFLQVDATASIGGARLPVDEWQIDCVTAGLQKCLMGPSGAAPITLSNPMAEAIYRRRHIEEGLRPKDYVPGAGLRIASNYFDLAMIMDYWSDRALK